MANKSRRRKTRRTAQSGRQSVRYAPKRVSPALLQGDQELGSLFAFLAWHQECGILPDVNPVLVQLKAFFPIYAELSSGAPVSAMDPGLVAQHVESLEDRDPEFAGYFCAVLFEYMHFLKDTGRWSGTEESYWVLHDVLYHGMLNEKFSPVGWPRTRTSSSQQASFRSA
ncbi:MAG TPA: hypothetical protein VJS86_02430 [Arthrobacter sp.]|nr:hypothetical protein [Arthrobacter sp.]